MRIVRALLTGLVIAGCGGSPHPAPAHDLDVDHATHVEPVAPPIATETPHETTPVTVEPPGPIEPPAPVLPPPGPTIDFMGWPADTQSFELHSALEVYATPNENATQLGKIAKGARLPLAGAIAGEEPKKCKQWLAVLPAGYICARHYITASKEPAHVDTLPPVPPGELLPQKYYQVTKGAPRFKDVAAVQAGTPLPEPKEKSSYMVTKGDVVDVDGTPYITTGVGLIAADDLSEFHASTFSGIDLVATPPPQWPFAWVTAKTKKDMTIRVEPQKKAAVVEGAEVAFRQIVPVLEEKDGYVRIADGQWILKSSVRIARQRERPAVEGAVSSRWIDVDRDEEVMIAYDGNKPVYATLVSTGGHKKDTPPALYRIRSKSAAQKMAAEEREESHYEVSEVPWATRFRSGLYFHAAYWHDDFGKARSHGCVNLAPKDAKWVYDWTTPTMPTGWSELEVPMDGSMVVRVYDAKDPDPKVFDYDKEAVERAKIRKQEEKLKKARLEAEAAAAAGTPTDPAATPASPTPAPPPKP